ncbi:MAG: hypothetical protein EP297_06940, partial [Gammaproteobacteria bacterium]
MKDTSLLKPVIFLAILLSYQTTFALGLKQPDVRSHFGEPLHIVIPLTLAANELGHSVIIQQISPKKGDQPDTSKFLPKLDLLFELAVDENMRHQIIINTVKPVNELILDLSLMVQVGPNQIIRQYSILLDPVTMPAKRKVARRKIPPLPTTKPAKRMPAKMVASEGTYVVQSGDSLSKIAQKFKG